MLLVVALCVALSGAQDLSADPTTMPPNGTFPSTTAPMEKGSKWGLVVVCVCSGVLVIAGGFYAFQEIRDFCKDGGDIEHGHSHAVQTDENEEEHGHSHDEKKEKKEKEHGHSHDGKKEKKVKEHGHSHEGKEKKEKEHGHSHEGKEKKEKSHGHSHGGKEKKKDKEQPPEKRALLGSGTCSPQ